MTPEWTYDPVIPKFVPDPELMARCQREQMAQEKESWSQGQRYVRQQYETAFAATRVAFDAVRAIWPIEADSLHEDAHARMQHVLTTLTDTYRMLDEMAVDFYSMPLLRVQRGFITTHEELDDMEIPR